jgi:hypothetical protein
VQNQKRHRTITTYLTSCKNPFNSAALDLTSPEKTQCDATPTSITSFASWNNDIVDLVDSDVAEFDFTYSPTQNFTPERSFNPDSSLVPAVQKNTFSGYKRAVIDLSKLCVKCKQRKANDACLRRSCKTCCVGSTAHCSLTDHMREKKGMRGPYSTAFVASALIDDVYVNQQVATEFERKIHATIAAKKHIFIAYKGKGCCCDIAPHSTEWKKEKKDSWSKQWITLRMANGRFTYQRFRA